MPFCAYCGSPVVASTAFCPACGKPASGAPVHVPVAAPSGSSAAMIAIFVVVGGLVLVAVLGIVAAIAIPNLLTAMQSSKQKRTMADLRSVATALESYSTDNNAYPRVESFEELRAILTPTYIRELPQMDGWGAPIRYECRSSVSEDSAATCDSYWVSSGGRDRTLETDDPTLVIPQTTVNFDCDIIYTNGEFVQYPQGSH